MKKLLAILVVAALATTAMGQYNYLVDEDLADIEPAVEANGVSGLEPTTYQLTSGNVLVEQQVDGGGTGFRDNLDSGPDDEWFATNQGFIGFEDLSGVVQGAITATAGDDAGIAWAGAYTGSTGEFERIRINHTVTQADIDAENGNPYVVVADLKAIVHRVAGRASGYQVQGLQNGSVLASSDKWYVASDLAATENINAGNNVLDFTGFTTTGNAQDGPEALGVNSGIFSLSSPLAIGDTLSVELYSNANDDGAASGSVDKNVSAGMSNARFVQLADGDADGDLDVDTADINPAVINFTGAGGSGKVWSDGDFDLDGDVDTADINGGVVNFTGAMAEDDGIANLIIDRTDGSVILDADGAVLGGFTIFSAGGEFITTNTDFSDLPSGLTDNIATQIGWSQPFSEFPGVAELGNILPAGLDDADYLADVTGIYAVSLNAGGGGGDLQISVIPEPATLSLLAIGGAAALLKRRRRF